MRFHDMIFRSSYISDCKYDGLLWVQICYFYGLINSVSSENKIGRVRSRGYSQNLSVSNCHLFWDKCIGEEETEPETCQTKILIPYFFKLLQIFNVKIKISVDRAYVKFSSIFFVGNRATYKSHFEKTKRNVSLVPGTVHSSTS